MKINSWLKLASFGIKNRSILDCDSEEVKKAMQRPETKLMQCFSKIENSLSQRLTNTREAGSGQTSGNQSFVLKLLRKLQFWKKKSTMQPHPLCLGSLFSSELDPPEDFIRIFAEKHAFISRSFSSTSISIWLTILLFQEKSDLCSSQQSILYMSRILEQLGSLQQAVRSTFMVVHDISHRDSIDLESNNTESSESNALRFLKSTYLGSEGVCLVRFAKMTSMDLADVMADKGLEAFSRYDMSVIPISQLIEAQRQVSIQSVATKVLRIRDATPSDSLWQRPMQDEDKHQSLACDTPNEKTFPDVGRQIPAFGSKPLYQQRVALSHMQKHAIPAGSQQITPPIDTMQSHTSSKLERHHVAASSAREDDNFDSSVVQPTSRDAYSVEKWALKVQQLNEQISDLKSFYEKRLKLAETTISNLNTKNDELSTQVSLLASSSRRTKNAVSEERDDSRAEPISDFEYASSSRRTENAVSEERDDSRAEPLSDFVYASSESEAKQQQQQEEKEEEEKQQQQQLKNLLQLASIWSEQIADLD